MAARDLAIGLLLGGGGGSTSLLQEFIANSKKLKEIPIDNQYHYALHVISVNPTQYPAIVPVTAMRSFDLVPAQIGCNAFGGMPYYRNSLYAFMVAYENDVPIFAQYSGNPWWYNPNCRGDLDTDGKLVVLPDGVADIDMNSLTLSANELSFWKSGLTQWDWQIHDTASPSSSIYINGTYTFRDYDIYYDSDNVPYAVLDTTHTNTFSGYVNNYINPNSFGVIFMDMTPAQFSNKIRDIYVAINAANGVTVPEAYWGRVYNARPE